MAELSGKRIFHYARRTSDIFSPGNLLHYFNRRERGKMANATAGLFALLSYRLPFILRVGRNYSTSLSLRIPRRYNNINIVLYQSGCG